MERLAARLEQAVGGSSGRLSEAVAVRMQLSVTLDAHLAEEDASIYPALARSSRAEHVRTGECFERELADLAVDWQAYLTEWSEDAAEADWSTFAAETKAMMDRLRKRIDRENVCLLPLAMKSGAMPLRVAA